mmetsp:Transcript_17266/g.51920  ORF Transcript_17266/g.51920 Transcript_17266/m.51920 type:complete len:202 (-) Transcript_17266:1082-1687(-)
MVPLLALPHLELRPLVVRADKQVADLLVVDLDEGALELHPPPRPLLGDLEQLVEGAHIDARVVPGALHGVGLARTSLAVGKDADIVSIHHGHDEVPDARKEHRLRGVLLEDLVELPGLLHPGLLVADLDLVARGEGDAAARLVGGQRPHAAVDTDVALEFLHEVVELAPPGTLKLVLVLPLLGPRLDQLLHVGHPALHRLL